MLTGGRQPPRELANLATLNVKIVRPDVSEGVDGPPIALHNIPTAKSKMEWWFRGSLCPPRSQACVQYLGL